MTRVAGIPEQLRSLAATLVASSPELELAATMLASAATPEMPPGVAIQIQEQIARAEATVRRAADTGQREGQDLKHRGLWLEVADQIVTLWKPGSPALAMADTPLDAIEGVERFRVARLMEAWGKYARDVLPVAATKGDESLAALNAELRFREANSRISPSRFSTLVDGAGSAEAYEEALGPLATFADAAGKFLPPAAIIAGVIQFALPEHRHGALMVADRAAGAGTALGSAAPIAAELGLISLGPVGIAVITGVLVVAGAWELYENRAEVAKLTVAGAKFLADHPYVLAGPAGIAVHELWDNRRPLARAAVTTLKDTAGVADAGARLVIGGIKKDMSDAKSLVSGSVSEGKHLLGDVGIHF